MSLSVDAFPACFQYTSLVRTELAGKVFDGCQHVLRFKQERFFVIRNGVSERENDIMMSKATQRESATLLSCETNSKTLQELLDALPHCIWIARPEGFMEYANRHWRTYTTLTLEQAQGQAWLQCVHPDDRQHTLDAWQTAIQTGAPSEMELRMRNGTTGAYQWFLVRGEPHKDGRGTILKWFGTCTDIEEQKKTEERVKESQENWRILAETLPQLVWTTQPDGAATYFNQRYYDYVGVSPEHALGYGWQQFLHPDDAARTLAFPQRSLQTGKSYETEYRLQNSQTGNYRWFLVRAMPVRDGAGQIVKWFGTSTDIEEQKQTEEALRQSQERIRALIDSNIIGITSVEMEGEVIVDANEAFLPMTGHAREEVQSRTLSRMNIAPPEQAPLF